MSNGKDLQNKLKVAIVKSACKQKTATRQAHGGFEDRVTIKICCSTHRAACFARWANHDECLPPKHPNHR
jgi:hypothetical protein